MSEEQTSDGADHDASSGKRQYRDPEDGLTIGRDATFTRIAPDEAYVIPHGGDLELSLIALGPDPMFRRNKDQDGSEGFARGAITLRGSLTEIGRIKMAESSAGTMAFNIIRTLASQGTFRSDKLRETFEDILKAIPEQETSPQDAEEPNETSRT